MNPKAKCKESSGNVFADLSIPNPEETLAKAERISPEGRFSVLWLYSSDF